MLDYSVGVVFTFTVLVDGLRWLARRHGHYAWTFPVVCGFIGALLWPLILPLILVGLVAVPFAPRLMPRIDRLVDHLRRRWGR